jgi:hypothetical protein
MPLLTGPEKVLQAALEEWRLNVTDPHPRITAYYRQGLGWTSEPEYVRVNQSEWCGAFAAWCYRQAGADPALLRSKFASTWRLHDSKIPRVPLDQLAPGDILVITKVPEVRWYGHHICLVTGFDPVSGLIHTIEGNARGRMFNGRVAEGVVQRTRPMTRLPDSARCPISGLPQSSSFAFRAYRPATVGGD